MCGIAGYINHEKNLLKDAKKHNAVTLKMCNALRHRGPDAHGNWVGENAAFSHSRLAVIDIEGGIQPMKRTVAGYDFIITYNGELYNGAELKRDLKKYGYHFTTESDTEILLYSYIHYGTGCAERLNGIYAFCVWDSMRRRAFLCRDRFGVKPLFYTFSDGELIFASELKALFEHPGVKPYVSKEGLCEIFAVSPARTEGCGVFKDVYELPPGEYMISGKNGIVRKKYWKLESRVHEDTYEETIERVRQLVTDSVKRQLVSDVPIGTLLSGGLDSSVITAIGARNIPGISTYSFDYVDNDKFFTPTAFQPDSDAPWVKRMTEEFNTNHTYLYCDTNNMIDLLEECVRAKDLPGMADVDASLLYFCREIKKHHTVILSGECSDEIFGGYPWFRDPKAFERAAFPWCYDLSMRNDILLPEVGNTLDIEGYSNMIYQKSIAETPRLSEDSDEERRRREISYLNIKWFMTNLLDRKDRMSMASGLEVRVPFCDHRLVEYVWNIPWSMKNKDNVSKNILREAARDILPHDVLYRKKSPYPKTHNPAYENAVKEAVLDTISDPNAPILALCDKKQIEKYATGEFDYGKPFFGQLMAGPQFLGFILQVNYWLKDYKVKIL